MDTISDTNVFCGCTIHMSFGARGRHDPIKPANKAMKRVPDTTKLANPPYLSRTKNGARPVLGARKQSRLRREYWFRELRVTPPNLSPPSLSAKLKSPASALADGPV